MIREIILSYARKPSSLLLAIIPANIDIVNSEALKFVSEIDPAGQRTLGVLSKIDLMDQGTNALDILLNRGPVRLALGFVGVVCRSQKAINEGTSIQQSLENEEKFFSSHPIYKYACAYRLFYLQIQPQHQMRHRVNLTCAFKHIAAAYSGQHSDTEVANYGPTIEHTERVEGH